MSGVFVLLFGLILTLLTVIKQNKGFIIAWAPILVGAWIVKGELKNYRTPHVQ